MKKIIVATLALLIAVSGAWAQQGRHCGDNCCGTRGGMAPKAPMAPQAPMAPGMGQGMGHRGMQGPGFMRFADDLELSDDQIEQLEAMRLQHHLDAIDRRAAVQKAKIRMQSLMHDTDASEAEVTRAIEEAAMRQADMHKMKYQHHKAMLGVLTDQQQAKLKELRKDRRDDRREMMKQRRGDKDSGPQFRDRRYRSSN